MKSAIIQLICTVALLSCVYSEQQRLNDFIKHFEGLSYDTEALHNSHNRARRSTDVDHYVSLKFKALGRSFNLRLKRDTSTFSKDLKIQLADGSTRDHDTSYIYDGYVKGELRSRVHGSIINGVFAGRISTPSGAYFVDKSEVYFRDDQPFHSVIYHEKHIESDAPRLKRGLEGAQCGSADDGVVDWMRTIQNSATHRSVNKRSASNNGHRNSPQSMYSRAHNLYRRETENTNQKTCTLFLQTDPMLWDYMTGDDRSKGELGYSVSRANEEITSLLADHVSGIKDIYVETDFSTDHRGYSFVVRRLQIMNSSMCNANSLTASRFCASNIDVTNFLNLNSLSNHDDYCLAYMFTYRDFTGGTLGLAWVGANSRAAGGICEKWKEYKENGEDVWKSLNTGIVTLVNYGSRVPPKVSTLTFAHEVGHNFGSPHDRTDECTPYTSRDDKDGNYIMFASATSGDRPNNKKFSECSKASISQVLTAVVEERHGKKNCLVDNEEAFCGNGIVEEGEICDCGYAEDCIDRCCWGRNNTARELNDEYPECELKGSVRCSPTQGPCCTDMCEFVDADALECHAEEDCSMVSSCDGISARCPAPAPKENDTFCNEDTQVCLSGDCTGSICSLVGPGWEQCYLTAPDNDDEYDKGNLCFVACKNPDNGECISSSPKDDRALDRSENSDFKDFLEQHMTTAGDETLLEEGIKLPPGAPCDNFKGYCDVFNKCRGVDADGPLAKLKKLFFSSETYDTVRKWVTVHWWAVMLMGIGLVIGMGAFIAVCAVHTPSSNPNRKPARRVSDTLRRRPRPRAQGPPPGYGQGRGGGGGPSSRPPPYNPRANQYEMKPNRV